MSLFLVTLVGTHGPGKPIEAPNVFHAIAEAADCTISAVCLPIWTDATNHRDRAARLACFMPLDDSGRQWLATRGDASYLADDYRISP